MGDTHFSNLKAKRITTLGSPPLNSRGTAPEMPVTGDFYWDVTNNVYWVYNSTMTPPQWVYTQFTTTTSTSTSTTSTSTSTTSTSTSSSTSSSTSITTSTSTTTTL